MANRFDKVISLEDALTYFHDGMTLLAGGFGGVGNPPTLIQGILDKGVRVVGINPGPVATDRLITLLKKRATDAFGDPERWPELTKQMPYGRPAHPEEIAPAVCFLASDLSAYTSGIVLNIDGGIAFRG